MKALRLISLIIALISGALCLLLYAVPRIIVRHRLSLSSASAIGIIGSADGPTSVFVSAYNPKVQLVVPVAFAVSLVVWLRLKKQKT